MSAEAVITFDTAGTGHCLYTETVDLSTVGRLDINRATTIEFDNTRQLWCVREVDGSSVLYTSSSRQSCIEWEHDCFNRQEIK